MNERSEKALIFGSGPAALVGILHPGAHRQRSIGVLVVVGGPQYRVGSHRQFVVMARALAASGYDVLRFDYQGMGDAEGRFAGFEHCGQDIQAALDVFCKERPALQGVAIFGLCDGASAAMMYAPRDPRIVGLIAANPWVRTEGTQAATILRHYYWKRPFQKSFWVKLLKGGLDIRGSVAGLSANVKQARSQAQAAPQGSYIDRMRESLRSYSGNTLVVLSGDDLTAREFADLFDKDKAWLAARRKMRLSS